MGCKSLCACSGSEFYPSGNLGSMMGQSGGVAGAHYAHRRSLTNLSELGAEKSPESASRFRPPPESLEAQLSHKLQVLPEPILFFLLVCRSIVHISTFK